MKNISLLNLAIIFSLLIIGTPTVVFGTDLRVSHQLPPKHHIAKQISAWGSDIEKFSNGSIKVKMVGANQAF